MNILMSDYTFKDAQRGDFSTFLNLDEFAEKVNVDGQIIDGLLDRDTFRERQTQSVSIHADGVESYEISLFCREEDLPYVPRKGSEMHVNDEWYFVKNCISNAGILEISLGVHHS
ncbi:hypothetical protein GOP80_06775 [Planococcaceae bacterium Storch 2/2-2]|nr:hypothetical protein [Planococcaceae bacterium Storch 2/2-2]